MLHAAGGCGKGGEPFLADHGASHIAGAVGAIFEPGECLLDLLQLVAQGVGEGSVLPDLRRDLAPIGEVVVEVEFDLATRGQLVDASEESGALGVQCLTELCVVVGHVQQISGDGAWPGAGIAAMMLVMAGVIVILIVLCVVLPVVVLVSCGILAGILGGFLNAAVDAENEGSELLELSNNYPG